MKPFFKPIHLLSMISVWIVFCCSAMLEWDSAGNLIAHSYSVWGDWSAHFTFISNLLERGPEFLAGDNPIYAGIPFQYPFLSHVITAFIALVLRISPISATFYSSLTLMFALPFCIDYLFRGLKLKPWTSAISVILFLFIGGFQFLDSSLKTTEPLTNQFDLGSVFTQFIAFEFFPQRAFVFGLIAFSTLGGFLLRKIETKKLSTRAALACGFLIALTTLLHLHTWIALALSIVSYFIFSPRPELRKKTFSFGMAVAGLSALFLSFLLLRNHASETRSGWDIWFPGWAQNSRTHLQGASVMNPIIFWIYNTGIFLPLALYGFFTVRRNRVFHFFFASGSFLFVFANFINIQPYFYDNLKLFTYSFLFLAPFTGLAFETFISKFKYKAPAIAVCVILVAIQCYSAIHDLQFLREGHQSAQFFSAKEFALAEEFSSLRKSPDDLVLISPKHNHWVPCLSGNPVVLGYDGWLWSWGINYGDRKKQVEGILLGQGNILESARTLRPKYIVIDRNDRIQNQPINADAINANFKLELARDNWEIYSTGF